MDQPGDGAAGLGVSGYDDRCWAVESARGVGYLLSQQLVAAGERVLDVPPMMASRVRVLGSGRSQKKDPNDARSVAIAALRHPGLRVVVEDDHTRVLGLLAKRHRGRPHLVPRWGVWLEGRFWYDGAVDTVRFPSECPLGRSTLD
ncbi:MAG: IS110 family transposase [Acidimicrobiia bacterium]|nr:IS110 family transposase [Acidimicrobiia bacterium]